MKKICLLMTFVMLLSAFATACTTNGANDNSAVSDDVSETVSETVSEEKSEDASEEESEVQEVFEYATVVSNSMKYTTSVEPGDSYSDSYNSELTDGVFAEQEKASYTDTKLVGFAPGGSSSVNIVIDLQDKNEKLYQFEVSFLATKEAGVAPPSGITVYGSNDNEDFTRLGRCKMPPYEDNKMQTATLTLEKSVSYRYIRFNISAASFWVFIDELSVIANVESEDSSKLLSEEINNAYKAEELTATQREALLNAVATGEINKTLQRISVSKGKNYTTSIKPDSTYCNEGKELTDGVSANHYESKTWVAFEGNTPFDIIIDLSSERKDIAGFSINAYSSPASGLRFPCCVTISVSSNKNDWTEVGRMYSPRDTKQSTFKLSLELRKTVKGRYVKFTVSSTDCRRILLDEVNVYSYGTAVERYTLYPAVSLPEVNENEYWSSSEKDYDKETDLIAGLTQQISCAIDPDHRFWSDNTTIDSKLMTDGVYATLTDIHKGGYFKFNQGTLRDVFYDLTKLSSVSSFEASFTHQPDWAVKAPSVVDVSLSADGKTWYKAGTMSLSGNGDTCIKKGRLKLEKPVEARFVAFTFEVTGWAGCDELDVYGTKKITSNTVKLKDSGFDIKKAFMENSFLAPNESILGGVKDLYLAYHSPSYERTYDDLLNMVGYVNQQGEIVDTMFDGVLFLMTGKFSSGSNPNETIVKQDAEWLLNSLFAKDKNILALEKVAAEVNAKLGLKDNKVKFYVTLYRPAENFGDINGEKLTGTLLEKRLKATEWFINEFEKELSKHELKNIEFAGYYWYREAMNDEENDMQLTNGISEIVHNHNSQFFWIPYYMAKGYTLWSERGLDVACMQPNYAFNIETPITNIKNTVDIIKRYGMCIEIEMSDEALNNDLFRQKYYEYLKGGVTYGYMKDCIHMYYLAATTFVNISKSSDPKVRAMYNRTYEFIKGTLDIIPEALQNIAVEAQKNTPYEGILAENTNELQYFTVAASPSHGTVTVEADGSFTYYPDKDYTGNDTFTFTYNEMLGESAETIVNINIK